MATVKISLSLVSLSPSSSSSSSTQSKLSPSLILNATPAKALKLRFNGKCLRAKPIVHRASRSGGITCSASSSPTTLPSALLFDCDGVLVDTEKDGHRISFNDTFKEVFSP